MDMCKLPLLIYWGFIMQRMSKCSFYLQQCLGKRKCCCLSPTPTEMSLWYCVLQVLWNIMLQMDVVGNSITTMHWFGGTSHCHRQAVSKSNNVSSTVSSVCAPYRSTPPICQPATARTDRTQVCYRYCVFSDYHMIDQHLQLSNIRTWGQLNIIDANFVLSWYAPKW